MANIHTAPAELGTATAPSAGTYSQSWLRAPHNSERFFDDERKHAADLAKRNRSVGEARG